MLMQITTSTLTANLFEQFRLNIPTNFTVRLSKKSEKFVFTIKRILFVCEIKRILSASESDNVKYGDGYRYIRISYNIRI